MKTEKKTYKRISAVNIDGAKEHSSNTFSWNF